MGNTTHDDSAPPTFDLRDSELTARLTTAMSERRATNAKFLEELKLLVGAWGEGSSSESTEATRRVLIRSQFASMESDVGWLKRFTLLFPERLTAVQELALRGVNVSVKNTGEVEEKPRSLDRYTSLRLAFRAASETWAPGFNLDIHGAGWEAFRKAAAIRNRLTHPESLEDFSMSSDEAEVVRMAFNWFQGSLRRNTDAFGAELHRSHAALIAEEAAARNDGAR